ncbi:diacylglycerol kinase [Salinisphaera sp. P385]|uniref:Diacylglycerol kinase n=1 Tax=Spectribacter acetivorans TaxID=3075603 RepID=A0ABU3B5D8_9GAMM|nr:diacylglycerol kinase [Salinisphaera sp. P385]MDT0617677.1 diacylglycerol kinase [Salinisphaera sp. P385]
MSRGLSGWPRLWRATRVSYRGLGWAWRNEEAFRIEAVLFVALLPAAYWWGDNGLEQAVCVMSLFLVMITELLNTGIEAAIDRIGTEHHQLSGAAKDVASAAVHLSLIQVPVVWGLIGLN